MSGIPGNREGEIPREQTLEASEEASEASSELHLLNTSFPIKIFTSVYLASKTRILQSAS